MLVGDILSDDGITGALLQTGETRIGERTGEENRREDQRGSGALVGHTSTDPTEASTHCHCGVIKHANRGKFRQNDCSNALIVCCGGRKHANRSKTLDRKKRKQASKQNNSLVVVGFVQRPLQVQALTRGDSHVNLHREERFREVFLRRVPSNTIHGGKHLTQERTDNEWHNHRGGCTSVNAKMPRFPMNNIMS